MSVKTNPKPYFSIIIPCLNEEHYLPDLLKSLNHQTFQDFDVHVVDGNSDDNTAQVAKDFKSKYSLYLHSTKTRSVSFQRNLGASKAKGDVLVFFDADTTIPKDYLKKVYQAYQSKHPHFLTTYVKVDSDKASELMFGLLNNLVFEIGKLLNLPFALGAMQSVLRSAFIQVGGYDNNTKFGEDSQLFQKLSEYNYHYTLLPSPRYTFSLRRLQKNGILETMNQYLKLNLSIFLKGYHFDADYDMGGSAYNEKEAVKIGYIKSLQPLFQKLRKRSQKQNQKFKQILEMFFDTDQ